MAIYRKEIKLEAGAAVAVPSNPLFCPQCGKRMPDGSKFCLNCGSSLAGGQPASGTPDHDLAPLGPPPPPEHSLQRAAVSGFVVSREDLHARYASMADDDLIALSRSELTDVARYCLDQELSRRGIVTRRVEDTRETSAQVASVGPRARGAGLRSVIGWALIVIAVFGGGQQLSERGFLGSLVETLPAMALMIALGVGLIRRWSGKRVGITLACVLAVPMFLVIAMPRSRGRADAARVTAVRAQINALMTALGSYKLDTGSFPTTEQGLQALRSKPENVRQWAGPYIAYDIPKDPWGRDYLYKYPGEHGDDPDLVCLGEDGQPGGVGTSADIVSWKAY